MSYILEAIKKADQKRKLGSVPDVHTEHGSTFSGDRRARWPYWVAALLFVNAGLLGWWLIPNISAPVVSTSKETAPVASNVAQKDDFADASSRKAKDGNVEADTIDKIESVPPEVVSSAPEIEDQTVLDQQERLAATLSDDVETPPDVKDFDPVTEKTKGLLSSKADAESAPVDSSSTLKTTVPDVAAQQATEVKTGQIVDSESADEAQNEAVEDFDEVEIAQGGEDSAAAIETLDSTEQEPRIVGSSSGPRPEAVVSEDDLVEEYKDEQEKESAEKALAKIPYYYQLPAAAQQTLPDVHISFHMFAKRPSARIVSVNGKILREGQELDQKVKLEEITPSGVVLLSDSWRFKVDVE